MTEGLVREHWTRQGSEMPVMENNGGSVFISMDRSVKFPLMEIELEMEIEIMF